MAFHHEHRARATPKVKRKDAWEFRVLFIASFCLFLVAALVDRLMPHRWLAGGQPQKVYKSIFAEAKEAASTSIPYAFMG